MCMQIVYNLYTIGPSACCVRIVCAEIDFTVRSRVLCTNSCHLSNRIQFLYELYTIRIQFTFPETCFFLRFLQNHPSGEVHLSFGEFPQPSNLIRIVYNLYKTRHFDKKLYTNCIQFGFCADCIQIVYNRTFPHTPVHTNLIQFVYNLYKNCIQLHTNPDAA